MNYRSVIPWVFYDSVKLITWSARAQIDPSDSMVLSSLERIPGMEAPSSMPAIGFVALQDSALATAVTQTVMMDARKDGKSLVYHRFQVDLKEGVDLLPEHESEAVFFRQIPVLPLHLISTEMNDIIANLPGLRQKLSSVSLEEGMEKHPTQTVKALFEELPQLRVIMWTIKLKLKGRLLRIQLAVVKDDKYISDMEHLVAGGGSYDFPWSFDEHAFAR